MIELHFARDHGPERAFAIDGPDVTLWLNGNSDPIHEANKVAPLLLTDATVHDYVRFFGVSAVPTALLGSIKTR